MLDMCFFKKYFIYILKRSLRFCIKYFYFNIIKEFGVLFRVNIVDGYMMIFWLSGLNLYNVFVF